MTGFISREALENWVREEVASLDSKEDREFVIQRWRNEIPDADVAPIVHGRWIKVGGLVACSVCKENPPRTYHNFCPNCGAKMDGDTTQEGPDR